MKFEADMLTPQSGTNDLGQPAKPSTSFVRYNLELRHRQEEPRRSVGPLEIFNEELTHIRSGEAKKELAFPVDNAWFKAAVTGRRFTRNYISTTTSHEGGARVINVHQDGGSGCF
jgi:hypothetical protein